MTRHEEQKRERRRAAREDLTQHLVRVAERSTMPASHHIEALKAHEEASVDALFTRDASHASWRLDRIRGHAIRAIVAMLREVLS